MPVTMQRLSTILCLFIIFILCSQVEGRRKKCQNKPPSVAGCSLSCNRFTGTWASRNCLPIAGCVWDYLCSSGPLAIVIESCDSWVESHGNCEDEPEFGDYPGCDYNECVSEPVDPNTCPPHHPIIKTGKITALQWSSYVSIHFLAG